MELSKAYEPEEIEARWYPEWERRGLFTTKPHQGETAFSIVLPPPNVTGVLHMGHALNHMLQDVLVRRARMKGLVTLWVPGTDHAGIATQNVVERELQKEGLTRHDLGREAFVERVWGWKREYGSRITEQMRALGNSCDWSRERFTMDEGLSRAVRTIFVRWFEDGLIYRGNRIINWCPRCTTALSDIEVEHKDVAGEIVTFRYAVEGGAEIPVATTRLETMLGDSGIAVHPDDERYRDLVGKRAVHPFFTDRTLEIVADEAVELEFGTGAVKVTPAHDPTDFEIGERHGLAKINIFDKTAQLTSEAGKFEGLDRYEARKSVLDELQALGVVDKVERPYVHSVGHCYRCGTELEPWLSEQWFVKMKPLAEPAIEVVRDGRVRFVPARFAKTYLDWMENLRDWCISRQLWWGHRIPVWYCGDCGQASASMDDLDTCPKCSSKNIEQDPDVLDTWFSSQLWPFSTLGWPDETEDVKYFYPTSVLVTGYDIIYLWVARMIFSGLSVMDDVPFRDVFINGIVRDFEGKKMSKSMGNVMDPLEMIDRYGADALRFSLAFASVPGNDLNASEKRVEDARNFANKLWNAARFIFLGVGDERPSISDTGSLTVEDRWILSRLDRTVAEVEMALESYNTAEAMHSLHSFVWSEFCDWYVELAKLRADTDSTANAVLLEVLDITLRSLHPVMPFITEELWSHLHPGDASIMIASWPDPGGRLDERAEATLETFQDVVRTIRRAKIDNNIPQGARVGASLAAGTHAEELAPLTDALRSLARLGEVEFVDTLPPPEGRARAITDGGIEVSIDLPGAADPEAERTRLTAKLAELDADISRAEGKLANSSFVERAPEAIVAKEREKLGSLRASREKVTAQLGTLA